MIHIRKYVTEDVAIAVCEAPPNDTDDFVDAAMQSDCDDCRTHPSINVGRVNDVRWDGRGKLGVQPPVPAYNPQPWDIKTVEQERQEHRAATAQQHNVTQGVTTGSYSFTPDLPKTKKSRRGEK